MRDKITLLYNMQNEVTVLPNKFIDEYMIKADGEYVKIYLLILRLQGMGLPIDVDRLADHLELTRKDVLRALSYWEKAGLLQMGAASEMTVTGAGAESSAEANDITADKMRPSTSETDRIKAAASSTTNEVAASMSSPTITTVPEKNTLSPTEVANSMKDTDLERTIYMAETYIGRPFSTTELNSFCYINDQLHFSADLMEYLIEYCVTRGKKSVRYIESVAINWYQQGITSVKEAKEQSTLYAQNVFPIMKAFGISNRDPGSAELDYIKKWNSLGLGTDIIIEACSRTLLATHQASFPYANKILEDWKRLGVRNTSDIKHLDDKYRSSVSNAGSSSNPSGSGYSQGQQARKGASGTAARKNATANQFHNFEQRTYDYSDLESRLLDKTRR